jgi:hypothetical protein
MPVELEPNSELDNGHNSGFNSSPKPYSTLVSLATIVSTTTNRLLPRSRTNIFNVVASITKIIHATFSTDLV